MKIIDLPFTQNLAVLFGNIARYQWSIWLDSTVDSSNSDTNINNKNRRYDIISGFPYKTVVSTIASTVISDIAYNNLAMLSTNQITQTEISNNSSNSFDIVNTIINNLSKNYNNQNNNNIPFWHGAIGYFGYDLNQLLFKQLKKQTSNNKNIPIMAVGFYAWALITDHKKSKTYLALDPDFITQEIITKIIKLLFTNQDSENQYNHYNKTIIFKKNFFKPLVTEQEYEKNFDKIKTHIENGDCYQVNYAIPFCGQLDSNNNISSWDAYQHLRKINPNPFGCYFNCTDNHENSNKLSIMSFSPERFIKIDNRVIITQPIKGTRKHVVNNHELNNKNITDLLNSEKDRAENIMITDLMRNDLNKFCIPGTVKALEICKLHTFPTVHHLISTITGKIENKYSSLDVFQGSFPGGSITGAPKIKAMEIIQQRENPNNDLTRYAYCGCIGYINIDNKLDMNIAIRTIVQENQNYHYWAGGGIVADSDCNSEYNEILSKIIKVC